MIAARALRLVLDGRTILDGCSFHVARGESAALVGPNGSGKTSILRCLLGLVPFTGSASVAGHDALAAPVAARAATGYVPQKAAFGEARASEVLRFVALLRGADRAAIGGLLDAVGLAAHADEPVRRFSGGMQQRLALAVALIGDPPVLLLDEPSASLDAEGQETFHRIVAGLRRRERTLLMASHRAEEVAALTDRVLHVEAGRVAGTADMRGRVLAFGRGERR